MLHALGYLLPPLLLLAALLRARRYPGERSLLAAIERRRGRRGQISTTEQTIVRRPRPRASLPRGGRLIASSLAVRPPPDRTAVPT
jgi:hypothetical protein